MTTFKEMGIDDLCKANVPVEEIVSVIKSANAFAEIYNSAKKTGEKLNITDEKIVEIFVARLLCCGYLIEKSLAALMEMKNLGKNRFTIVFENNGFDKKEIESFLGKLYPSEKAEK